MKVKLQYIIPIILAFLALFSCDSQSENNAQPNVIIVLADDMGYADLGITGSEIATPNLDFLAPYRAYKSQTFEGGIKTPLIFSWPNNLNAKEKILNETVHIIDVMPSLLDVANISLVNQKMDGSSFVGVINGTDEKIHRELYWEHQGNKAVWNSGYKLVQMHGENWELYDLKSGPYESNELKDTLLVMADGLEQIWNKWASKSGVEDWPLTNTR